MRKYDPYIMPVYPIPLFPVGAAWPLVGWAHQAGVTTEPGATMNNAGWSGPDSKDSQEDIDFIRLCRQILERKKMRLKKAESE